MAEEKVDLAKVQKEYEHMQEMFNRWNADLNEVAARAARVAAVKSVHKELDDYHQQTFALLDQTLERMKALHDQMVQAGVDTIKKMV